MKNPVKTIAIPARINMPPKPQKNIGIKTNTPFQYINHNGSRKNVLKILIIIVNVNDNATFIASPRIFSITYIHQPIPIIEAQNNNVPPAIHDIITAPGTKMKGANKGRNATGIKKKPPNIIGIGSK